MDWTKLDAAVDALRQDFIADTRMLVSIESVQAPAVGDGKPFGENVRKALDAALALGGKYGFRALDLDGYCGEITLEKTVGREDKAMGILCHLDIVPVGDGWTKNPLGGEVADGRIYGRGTVDDKGPAIAALCAMRAVRAAGIPLKHDVRLILGCDEENGSSDMEYYKARRRPVYDYGFSPDAGFPVIHIEKGRLLLKLSKTADDAQGILPVLRMSAGTQVNVVPAEARATVALGGLSLSGLRERLKEIARSHDFDLRAEAAEDGCAEIRAIGLQAHASTPEMGKNAAGMLLVALAELGAGGTYAQVIAKLAEVLGMAYDGGALGIAHADAQSGALTCNLGLLRCDARELSATLDIRYPICADEKDMCGAAAMALSDARIALTRLPESLTPLHVPEDSPLVQGLLRVYGDVTGLPAYAYAIGGGTYAHHIPNTVAFGPVFPDESDAAHMPDESVSIDGMLRAAKVFAHAIAVLAGDAQ